MSTTLNKNKILKAVVIKPGESFTPPPGADILSSTGVLSSTCNNIPEITELECYAFMSIQQNDTGSHTEPWQEDNITYKGVVINGTEYLFASDITWLGQGTDLPQAINATPVGGLFSGWNYNSVTDSLYGTKAYFVFKVPVGVIKSLELITSTDTNFSGGGSFTYNIKGKKRSDLISEGHANVPDCVN